MQDPGILEIAVRSTEHDATRIVELEGDLVISTQDRLGVVIDNLLAEGVGGVVAEVARLRHIDTPGLAFLTTLARKSAESECRFVVAAMPPRFREVVDKLRLEEALTFFDTAAAAVAEITD